MKLKEESEKVGLKLNIQESKIMAISPITSWKIDGETVSDFIFGAPKSLQVVTTTMKSIIFITSTIVWPQVNSREGTQLHPFNRKLD